MLYQSKLSQIHQRWGRVSSACLLRVILILAIIDTRSIIAQEARGWVPGGSLGAGFAVARLSREGNTSDGDELEDQTTYRSIFSKGSFGVSKRSPTDETRFDADLTEWRRLEQKLPVDSRSAKVGVSTTISGPRSAVKANLGLARRQWQMASTNNEFILDYDLNSNVATTQTSANALMRFSYQLDTRHAAGIQSGLEATDYAIVGRSSADGSTLFGDTILQIFMSRQQTERVALEAVLQQNLSFIGPYQARQTARGIVGVQMTSQEKMQVGVSRGRSAVERVDEVPQWNPYWAADLSYQYLRPRASLDLSLARTVEGRSVNRQMTVVDSLNVESKWLLSIDDIGSVRFMESRERQLLGGGARFDDSGNALVSTNAGTLGQTRMISLGFSHAFGGKIVNEAASIRFTVPNRAWLVAVGIHQSDKKYRTTEVSQSADISLTRFF